MPHSQNCWVRQMITCGSSEGGQAGGQTGGQAGGQGQGWSSCWCSSDSCFSTEELGKVLSETSLQHWGQLDTKHQINHIMVQQHHILLSLSFYIIYFFHISVHWPLVEMWQSHPWWQFAHLETMRWESKDGVLPVSYSWQYVICNVYMQYIYIYLIRNM